MIVNFIPFFKRKNFDDGVKEPDEVKHFNSFLKITPARCEPPKQSIKPLPVLYCMYIDNVFFGYLRSSSIQKI